MNSEWMTHTHTPANSEGKRDTHSTVAAVTCYHHENIMCELYAPRLAYEATIYVLNCGVSRGALLHGYISFASNFPW